MRRQLTSLKYAPLSGANLRIAYVLRKVTSSRTTWATASEAPSSQPPTIRKCTTALRHAGLRPVSRLALFALAMTWPMIAGVGIDVCQIVSITHNTTSTFRSNVPYYPLQHPLPLAAYETVLLYLAAPRRVRDGCRAKTHRPVRRPRFAWLGKSP